MIIEMTKRKRKCICCRNTIPSKVYCARTSNNGDEFTGKLYGGSICYSCITKMIDNINGADHAVKRFCTIKKPKQCTHCTKEFTGLALVINQEVHTGKFSTVYKFGEDICPECLKKIHEQLKEYEHDILIKSVIAAL